MSKSKTGALAFALSAAGCASQLPPPTPLDAAIASSYWAETSVADLTRGRKLYLERCSACHVVYKPEAYPAERWQGLVEEMVERSKLSPDQTRDITRYLAAASESARNPRTTVDPTFAGRLATSAAAPRPKRSGRGTP